MRPAWAIAAGILGALALAWWLGRDPPAGTAAATPAAPAATPGQSHRGTAHAPLYRWRDEAGVVQVTDIPPRDRAYTLVDVAALERRNLIDADPLIESAR
jgi:hypothetical protein